MSIIKDLEKKLKNIINEAGYDVEFVKLCNSSRPEFGEYQINEAMAIGKKIGKNPRNVAQDIVNILKEDSTFENVNIAGPGFINITLSESFLLDSLNKILGNIEFNIDKKEKKRIFLDYGGANIAKTLHVGHLRSANIGEALKRLAKLLGNDVISDVHFGDIGRQSGMVISEIKRLHPNLKYFDKNYNGEEVDFEITASELGEIYPRASLASKEDELRMEEVRQITAELEQGHKGYTALWNKIKQVSIEDIKKTYIELNTDFDLWEGEMDCYPYIPETIEKLKEGNNLYESEGALVIDVQEESDNSPMPPLVVVKSNGATLYATRELATLYSRVKRFNPEEFWYVTDYRQGLYFEQVFRASKKTGIVKSDVELRHLGFGTMNGPDGKPFKTRDGGVMTLNGLISLVKEETLKRINTETVKEEEKEEVAKTVAIAALKYADFLPFRAKDYIFDVNKFADLEGKTGPYLLYSTIRMKSLLQKVTDNEIKFIKIENSTRDVIKNILNLPVILENAYLNKSLNDIAEYLYKLTSSYNKFYAENRILTEENINNRISWIALTKTVYDINTLLLDTLAIKVPNKM